MKTRYNLTLEPCIVKQIDEIAAERNISRSLLVEIALKIYIKSNSEYGNGRSSEQDTDLKGQVKIC